MNVLMEGKIVNILKVFYNSLMDSDCEQVAKILHIFRDFYFIFTILEVFVCLK